eukprot:1158509-Pelagomonas_calceolata.AAC.1
MQIATGLVDAYIANGQQVGDGGPRMLLLLQGEDITDCFHTTKLNKAPFDCRACASPSNHSCRQVGSWTLSLMIYLCNTACAMRFEFSHFREQLTPPAATCGAVPAYKAA